MCGISGFISRNTLTSNSEQLLSAMTASLIHRGPNDQGIWLDREAGVGLAHTRLAVVDLSPAGRQPMHSPSGRYVIVFNGEIYNHLLLRKELTNINWRGHSDTETLCAAFDAWGIEETICRSVGMFAFAVWDMKTRMLILGRDRAGEKPIYYGRHGNVFLFASELKALKIHPDFKPELDKNVLSLYLRHNYVPAPYSIYKNTYKLMPGTLLFIPIASLESVEKTYWSASDLALSKANTPFKGDEKEVVDELDRLMQDSIAQQMISDVPLGAFLSGGIDSSLVVALMQAQSQQPIRTFSIGFNEKEFNEAHYAKAVANHLGTHHTELYVNTDDALKVIPKLSTLYDEPFADSSQIPTFLISQLAKQHVTVALTGDGGDELFCGYNRYILTNKLWGKISKFPPSIRKVAAHLIHSVSIGTWNKLLAMVPQAHNIGIKLHKGANVLASSNINQVYNLLISHHNNPGSLLHRDIVNPELTTNYGLENLSILNDTDRMMVFDFMTYLCDDILVKVDRAAMGVSLETRVPFLDHRIVEFAWNIPTNIKLRHGQSKWPLRQLLYRHVPKELIERTKMGFGIPLNKWLQGPLRDWAEDLLNERRLIEEGIFKPDLIRDIWQQHLNGRSSSHFLWGILMFQAWMGN